MNSINHDEYTYIRGDAHTEFYDRMTDKLLFSNLPPSEVLSLQDFRLMLHWGESISLDEANVSLAEEGTTLRVFYNKRWYTATKSKLQAFRSNWADKRTSFGASFAQAVRNELGVPDDEREDEEFLHDFYENFLDKSRVYFFLLRSSEGERIVCDAPPQAKAIHICTQHKFVNNFDDKLNIGIGTFSHTYTLPRDEQYIAKTIKTLSYKRYQGVIVECRGVFYKIILPQYKAFAEIRGTIASLRFCYISLRSPRDYHKRKMFIELYNKQEAVDELETRIFEMCLAVHKMYMSKYVLKQEITTNPMITNALYIIHKRFLVDRITTTPDKINDVLTEHPKIINGLLKLFKYKSTF